MVKGMRTYYQGRLFDKKVILVFSRWGKVASATTATQLINDFNVKEIIFTGVAGGVQPDVFVGDIVIGKDLYQHDMDASPLVKAYEVPLLGKSAFTTDPDKRNQLSRASSQFLQNKHEFLSKEQLINFQIQEPKIHLGDIASGDQFISSSQQSLKILSGLPTVKCVEMEGAAVAQVCFEYKVPFSIIRTISDNANHNAHIDFPKFAKEIASTYALGILQQYLY
jgi:adenosylhomocysteine nucleosidase